MDIVSNVEGQRSERQFIRVELAFAVELFDGKNRFTATTKNLSVGGCCVTGAYSLQEEAEIDCALFFVREGVEDPSLPPLRVRASVQWAADTEELGSEDRHVAGLQFLAMSEAQREWLTKTLQGLGEET